MFANSHYFTSVLQHSKTINAYSALSSLGAGNLLKVKYVPNLNNRLSSSFNQKEPKMMKINTPEFQNIFTPELYTLLYLFKNYNYEIRIAGGAVRDILVGKHPQDIDFATTATPEQMKEMFEKEEIRMINAKGEKHGTITARINNQNFEVTTLRIDVATNGRHAEVEYTKDWMLDANRRDLTINSMFLAPDGTLYDYFNGFHDLQNRRVLFVGNATTRIREDYLRILRYFRFYGRIAEDENSHDKDTLKVIKENISGLGRISGERIWMELSKILTGRFAKSMIEKLVEAGGMRFLGLPEQPDLREMEAVLERGKGLELKPMTIVASLLEKPEQITSFNSRVKLSSAERNLGLFIINHRSGNRSLKFYQHLLLTPQTVIVTREQISELFKYWGDLSNLLEFENWPTPRFPLNGHSLAPLGVPPGKAVGAVLNKLRLHWIESDFTATGEQLLTLLPTVCDQLSIKLQSQQL